MNLAIYPSRYQPFAWLLLGLLVVNCQDHLQNPTASVACQLATQVVTTESSTSKSGTTTQNTINGNRQLTKQVLTTTSTSGTVTTATEQTNNYQYDADGFLTGRAGQLRSTAANGTATTTTFEDKYQYQNERLVSRVQETVSPTGIRSMVTRTYEYDAQGALNRFSLVQVSGQTIQTYLGGRQIDCEFITPAGIRSKPFKFNAQGLVSEAPYFLIGHTGKFTYDMPGNLIKEEFFDPQGKPVGYHDHQYDTQKQNPNAANPTLLFKGHPPVTELTTTSFMLIPIYGPALRTSSRRYSGIALSSEESFAYSYNANGFPTESTLLFKNGVGVTTSQTKTDYTYQNCQ